MSRIPATVVFGVLVVAQLGFGATVGTGDTRPWSEESEIRSAVSSALSLVVEDVQSLDRMPATGEESVPTVIERGVIDRPIILFPPIGYSRWDDSDPLDNDTRRRIFERVTQAPGIDLTSVAATTDIPPSTVRYHVRVLVREQLIESERLLGNRRLFEWQTEDKGAVAALSNPSTARILEVIGRLEPVRLTDVAAEVERSPSTVSYHLSRIEGEGLVEKERDGEAVMVRLAPPARRVMQTDLSTA